MTEYIKRLNEGGQERIAASLGEAWDVVSKKWEGSELSKLTMRDFAEAYRTMGERFTSDIRKKAGQVVKLANMALNALGGRERQAPTVRHGGRNLSLHGNRNERETRSIVAFIKKHRKMLKFQRDPATGNYVVLRKADLKALRGDDGKTIVLEQAK